MLMNENGVSMLCLYFMYLMLCRLSYVSQNFNILTSPSPSMTLIANSPCQSHVLTTIGVSSVKTAVPRMPRPKVCFPPNFSAKIPPGICVTT